MGVKLKQIEDFKIQNPGNGQVLVYDSSDKSFKNGDTVSVESNPDSIVKRSEDGTIYSETPTNAATEESNKQVVNIEYLNNERYLNRNNISDAIIGKKGISVDTEYDGSGNNTLVVSAEIDDKTIKINRDGKLYAVGGGEPTPGGPINEDTFVFEDDLTTMYPIGKVNASLKNPATIPSAGKTFREVWDMIFYNESNPSVVLPTLSVTANDSEMEIGSEFYITATMSFKPGSYTYGPESAVTEADSYKAVFGGDEFDTKTFNISGFYTDAAQYIECSAEYSDDTVIPVTNIGNPYPSIQIKGGTVTKQYKIKPGYRRIFYGYSDYKTMDELDSEKIRAIGEYGIKAEKGTLPILPENTTADTIIVAVPASLSSSIKVVMPSSSFADVTTEFIKQDGVISVTAANESSPVDYTIWIYDPAKMDGTYQITVE